MGNNEPNTNLIPYYEHRSLRTENAARDIVVAGCFFSVLALSGLTELGLVVSKASHLSSEATIGISYVVAAAVCIGGLALHHRGIRRERISPEPATEQLLITAPMVAETSEIA